MATFLAHRTKIVSFVVNLRFDVHTLGVYKQIEKCKYLLIYRTYHKILWVKLF
jgi:hypothetical protein